MDYISHEDYARNVEARCSKDFHVEQVHGVLISQILGAFRDRADDLDQFKKLMFYGKMHPELESLTKVSIEEYPECEVGTLGTVGEGGPHIHNLLSPEQLQIFHAIIGIATEAGELVQAFINAMCQMQLSQTSAEDAFDHINLREEAGDVLWYTQLLLNKIGSNLDECITVNDRKLERRYGPAFNKDGAVNRDLDAERKELEQ